MKLKSIRLKNFQCFKDSKYIPIHDMTIFIGENDCGKTCILRALDIFLNNKSMDNEMFHHVKTQWEKTSEISLVFKIDPESNSEYPKEFIINNELSIKKEYKLDEGVPKSAIKRHVFKEQRYNNVDSLKATELKDIFQKISTAYSNVADAKEVLKKYIQDHFDALEKEESWADINWNEISYILPSLELYDSSAYKNPQLLVQKTLTEVYRRFFYDIDEDGNASLKKILISEKDKIESELNKKIREELKDKVRTINPKVKEISGDFEIDFAQGFSLANMVVDYGDGKRPINNVGEGSKKRLFLAIIEWDQEIRSKEHSKRTIKYYDEPDASLHYSAQKEIFYTFQKISQAKQANIQIIINTHSLSMIDRAPPKIINNIVHKDGVSEIEYLEGDAEIDIKDFLNNISEISGIKNSSLFFERCFLIVEGDTEDNALPILCRKLTGRTLSEVGVVLVNLKSNACWDSFLKLLNKNKSQATLLCLDKDTQDDDGRRVTLDKLRQIEFSQVFLDNNVILVGNKEFEDIFSDDIIAQCLNKYYPKIMGEEWSSQEVTNLRVDGKFSDKLKKMVEAYRVSHEVSFDRFRKPEFGKYVAEIMTKAQIEAIAKIKELFDKVNNIVK